MNRYFLAMTGAKYAFKTVEANDILEASKIAAKALGGREFDNHVVSGRASIGNGGGYVVFDANGSDIDLESMKYKVSAIEHLPIAGYVAVWNNRT